MARRENGDLNSTDAAEQRGLSRREVLKVAGAAAAAAALPSSGGCDRPASVPEQDAGPSEPIAAAKGGGYLERWRKLWTWDYKVPGTHYNNCAFQAHCAFNVYVKDGRVVREEQIATYPGLRDGIPDANPRGCQKGCQYSELMYGEARIKRPHLRLAPSRR